MHAGKTHTQINKHIFLQTYTTKTNINHTPKAKYFKNKHEQIYNLKEGHAPMWKA